jgi:ribonuclease Z
MVPLGRHPRPRSLPPPRRAAHLHTAADATVASVDLSIFFVGTAGSVPSRGRGLPCLLVRRGGEHLLFDCGEGTQRQLLRSVGLVEVDAVFITHFHADHWLGLPGLLKSLALRDRTQPLSVFGPRGLCDLMERMRVVYGRRLPFDLQLLELDPLETVERDGYLIGSVPVDHGPRRAFGYALVEHDRPGEFDPAAAVALGVPEGPAFRELQLGKTVGDVRPEQVMGEPRQGRKIVISGDTAPCEAIGVAAHGADVLVHEATFTQDGLERARETSHSTARQAAEIALAAQVRMLAITHSSARYEEGELFAQAQEVFPATEAPRDFDTIAVPFPERGAPVLERWPERRARERSQTSQQQAPPQAIPAP